MDIRWSLCDDDVIEVFREEGEDPERYSVKEFIAIHGEDALPDRDESKDEDTGHYYEYWASMLNLVNAWAKYQARRKLYANYACEDTRHRVEHVIVKSYGGDVNRLVRHIHCLNALVYEALAEFGRLCRICGVDSVDTMWLRLHLLEDKNNKSLRGKCQRRKDKNRPPVSICELL